MLSADSTLTKRIVVEPRDGIDLQNLRVELDMDGAAIHVVQRTPDRIVLKLVLTAETRGGGYRAGSIILMDNRFSSNYAAQKVPIILNSL